jgi:transposase
VISDPRRAQRRFDKLSSTQRQTLARARRSTSSKYGRALLRKRGQHIERSFAHVLDAGGMRRATLRGLENLHKRHQIAATCYNLSQLLRRLYGVGTPKQWAALLALFLGAALHRLLFTPRRLATKLDNLTRLLHRIPPRATTAQNPRSSTAC